MFSVILLLVGLSSANTQNTFVAVEWTSYSDGTITLVPPQITSATAHQPIVGSRLPAGQDLPPSTPAPEVPDTTYSPQTPEKKPSQTTKYPGLGEYGCLKQGYFDAGEGDVSNKFIAMIVVRAKYRNDRLGMTKENAKRQTLRESIYSSSALGSCKGSTYRFSKTEASQSNQWLNSERTVFSPSQYKGVFKVDSYKVDQVVHSYDTTPSRIQRNWDYWGKDTIPHTCSKPLPNDKRIRLCQMIARACKIEEVGCNRSKTETVTRDGGGNGHNGGDGPSGPSGPATDGPNPGGGETGLGNNADSHSNDNGGGHGLGPQ